MPRTRLPRFRTRLNGRRRDVHRNGVDPDYVDNPHIAEVVRADNKQPRKNIHSKVELYKRNRKPEDEIPEDVILEMGEMMKPGRPVHLEYTETTLRVIYGLAAIQCTKVEAASVFGTSPSTFNRFLRDHPEAADLWYNGQPAGRASLRRMQFAMAEKSAPMAIWLGKQLLDQRDKLDVSGPGGGPIQSMTVDPSQLAKLTPQQRQALTEALQILRPQEFEGVTIDADAKQIEYDPDA